MAGTSDRRLAASAQQYDLDNNVAALLQYKQLDGSVIETTTYAYDALNRKTQEIGASPTGTGSGPTSSYVYDSNGNLLAATDPNGNITNYVYDSLGRKVGIVQASPDPVAPWIATIFAYDAAGNLISQSAPAHATVSGSVLTIVTGELHTTTYTYDGLNRKISEVDPSPDGVSAGASTTYSYDANGNQLNIVDPNSNTTTYAYDALNRKTKEVDPDPDGGGALLAPTTIFAYDSAANLTSQTDPLGHTTTYAYDHLNRQTREVDPSPGGTTTYAYDFNGNELSVADAVGNTTTYSYDGLNRQLTDTNQSGNTRTNVYDAMGDVVKYTDRDGRVTTYGYDNLNRQTQENWLSGSGGTFHTIVYGYDLGGRQTSSSDADSTTAYTYDDLNRIASETDARAALPSGQTLVMSDAYDARGNRTVLELQTGNYSYMGTLLTAYDLVNVYAYDGQSRMTTSGQLSLANAIALGYVGSPPTYASFSLSSKLTTFGYDLDSNLTNFAGYNWDTGGFPVVAGGYSYDHLERLTGMANSMQTSPSTTTHSYAYQYDAASRLTNETNVDGTSTYSYDNDNRLTKETLGATTQTYTYDANGNRATHNGTTNSKGATNEITDDGTYTYAYDQEGNLTAQNKKDGSQFINYTWDYRDRLASVAYQNSVHTTTESIQYTYDTNNQRIAKTATGTSNVTEQYVYDQGSLLAAVSVSTGFVTQRYFNGSGVSGNTQAMAEETVGASSGETKWALSDNQGTVQDVVDNFNSTSSGHTILDHIVYDRYGDIISQTSSANDVRMGFTGYVQDAETGLDYANARYYQPTTGKFISTDPSGFTAGDTNLYAYVKETPTNATDPSGLLANFGTADLPSLNFAGVDVTANNNSKLAPVGSVTFSGSPFDSTSSPHNASGFDLVGSSSGIVANLLGPENPSQVLSADQEFNGHILRSIVDTERDSLRNLLSGNERGPMIGGVMDTTTGKVYTGLNTDLIDNPHPALAPRLVGVEAPELGHGELNALNDALWARGPDAQIDNTFMLYNRRFSNNPDYNPIMPQCESCVGITDGVTSIADAPSYLRTFSIGGAASDAAVANLGLGVATIAVGIGIQYNDNQIYLNLSWLPREIGARNELARTGDLQWNGWLDNYVRSQQEQMQQQQRAASAQAEGAAASKNVEQSIVSTRNSLSAVVNTWPNDPIGQTAMQHIKTMDSIHYQYFQTGIIPGETEAAIANANKFISSLPSTARNSGPDVPLQIRFDPPVHGVTVSRPLGH